MKHLNTYINEALIKKHVANVSPLVIGLFSILKAWFTFDNIDPEIFETKHLTGNIDKYRSIENIDDEVSLINKFMDASGLPKKSLYICGDCRVIQYNDQTVSFFLFKDNDEYIIDSIDLNLNLCDEIEQVLKGYANLGEYKKAHNINEALITRHVNSFVNGNVLIWPSGVYYKLFKREYADKLISAIDDTQSGRFGKNIGRNNQIDMYLIPMNKYIEYKKDSAFYDCAIVFEIPDKFSDKSQLLQQPIKLTELHQIVHNSVK